MRNDPVIIEITNSQPHLHTAPNHNLCYERKISSQNVPVIKFDIKDNTLF